MSNDLISRSAVMDYLREQQANVIIERNKNGFVSADVCDGMSSVIGAFMNFIVLLPAAYDVDKVVEQVVEQIEEYAHSGICESHNGCPYRNNEDMNCENCGAIGAIEIVKSGGIK